MNSRRYALREVFLTIQGEGAKAGSLAVFCRFSGCNVWSGNPEDRERDAAKGGCALWCDTEFRGTNGENGGKYGAVELCTLICELWPTSSPPMAVFTGGEPSLQMDDALVSALRNMGIRICVETNGSRALPEGIDWVCVSPKPPMEVVTQRYDEVKVIFPAFDPGRFVDLAPLRFVQPQDDLKVLESKRNLDAAIAYVKSNPSWRLSLQTHKIVGLK